MKNIQEIDGTDNSDCDIFSFPDDQFKLLLPLENKDIEFATDVYDRPGFEVAEEILVPMWKRRVEKPDVVGIHGTLFHQLDLKAVLS